MPQKIQKKSNFVGFKIATPETYIKDMDQDVNAMHDYLNNYPRLYTQAGEPTLADDDWGFWNTSGDFYLILNMAGTQKKVQLT